MREHVLINNTEILSNWASGNCFSLLSDNYCLILLKVTLFWHSKRNFENLTSNSYLKWPPLGLLWQHKRGRWLVQKREKHGRNSRRQCSAELGWQGCKFLICKSFWEKMHTNMIFYCEKYWIDQEFFFFNVSIVV